MKYAIGAVAAVALGLSMAVSAQAQTPQPSTNPTQANAGHAISHKDQIKQAQQALKTEGLYNGKIDGHWGAKSRQPSCSLKSVTICPPPARLDSHTFAALTREHGGAQHRLQHAEPARGRGR